MQFLNERVYYYGGKLETRVQSEYTVRNEGEHDAEQRKTQTLNTKGKQGKEETPWKQGWQIIKQNKMHTNRRLSK